MGPNAFGKRNASATDCLCKNSDRSARNAFPRCTCMRVQFDCTYGAGEEAVGGQMEGLAVRCSLSKRDGRMHRFFCCHFRLFFAAPSIFPSSAPAAHLGYLEKEVDVFGLSTMYTVHCATAQINNQIEPELCVRRNGVAELGDAPTHISNAITCGSNLQWAFFEARRNLQPFIPLSPARPHTHTPAGGESNAECEAPRNGSPMRMLKR